MSNCLNCGKTLIIPKPGYREKMYCDDACRMAYNRKKKKGPFSEQAGNALISGFDYFCRCMDFTPEQGLAWLAKKFDQLPERLKMSVDYAEVPFVLAKVENFIDESQVILFEKPETVDEPAGNNIFHQAWETKENLTIDPALAKLGPKLEHATIIREPAQIDPRPVKGEYDPEESGIDYAIRLDAYYDKYPKK